MGNTNIVQYSIVYYNTTYPSTMIFTVILAYYTTLAYLCLQIITLFYFLRNEIKMFCSLVMITPHPNMHTSTYRNKEFFLRSTVANFATTVFSYLVNNLKFITQCMYLHTHMH